MYLFILESIGTPELILIAVVALIVFGPRKLPQMAKTIAKTMAEFKNATNEFKSTWEKEAFMDYDNLNINVDNQATMSGDTSAKNSSEQIPNQISIQKAPVNPEIKELSAEDFNKFKFAQPDEHIILPKKEISETKNGKRDWL